MTKLITLVDGKPISRDEVVSWGQDVEHDVEMQDKMADGWAYWKVVPGSQYFEVRNHKSGKTRTYKYFKYLEGPRGEMVQWLYSKKGAEDG